MTPKQTAMWLGLETQAQPRKEAPGIEMIDQQLEIEQQILMDMGLPPNCMTMDGDQVLNNRKDYTPTDLERHEFARAVTNCLDAIDQAPEEDFGYGHGVDIPEE